MAVPVHLFLTNDGGTMICGSCDVAQREGSIELRGLQHNLSLPTDSATGKITGTRQHSPFQFTKELDSSSPYLFKAAATGQTLKTAEFRFYHINYSGQEEEYYRITLENVKVISVSPVIYDTRGCPGTGHMEEVAFNYEKITHLYKDGNLLAHDAWNERPTSGTAA
ncbi:Hcp family type VI secretion system effector [Enterobacter cloacae]|uniref:Hcp family type VI secretion system effector n=1 Tax=Enterobacter cloacae TaxID=550 RepID=UPI0032AFB276|nr:type VI secretion system tube protein Hcp [Enterobacter cloacae subsp. dissolvens]HCM9196145.1 type VI secretion system tube protein Hcp [Enterobacter cloacae subsp. dissolvens]